MQGDKLSNEQARYELGILYGLKCMLTGGDRNLTYHHIWKKCYGGNNSVENGALLCRQIHEWLHYAEKNNPGLYHLINECLRLYKESIEKEQQELIDQWENEVMPKARGEIKEAKDSGRSKRHTNNNKKIRK